MKKCNLSVLTMPVTCDIATTSLEMKTCSQSLLNSPATCDVTLLLQHQGVQAVSADKSDHCNVAVVAAT